MKRVVLFLVALFVLAAIAVPVINLAVGLPNAPLAKAPDSAPEQQAALDILSRKCANCHSDRFKLPFYAALPGAKDVIQNDIDTGRAYMDFAAALQTENGKAVAETILAKTEYQIERNEMPPRRYIALHWNGGLTSQERQILLDWITKVRKDHYASKTAKEFATEPVQPVQPIAGINAAKAALGEKLYHDKRLSKDDTISCASCHDLSKGGTDQQQYSTGVGGGKGGINSPTTFNSGYQFIQFWNGRAADLVAQADGPVNNPAEMASNWAEAATKLQQDAAFTQAFLAVYPDGYKKETCTDAIAEYEKTLTTPNARFDKYLMGDAKAISDDEKQGYVLFKDFGCATCHVGKILGGQSFERMGRKADYFAHRGGAPTDADLGRIAVTKKDADKHAFKVPTLRNIALTAPYFHDGSAKNLSDAVSVMATVQVGKTLSSAQNQSIVAFLKTLTGEYNGKPLS